MPRERRRYVASPARQRRVSSNDPQTLFLIDSQQPSHLGTPPTSPRRKRSPRSRSGWSRTSRRNTSRIARASSTSPRCAPRSHRSPAQLCAPHRRLQIDPPPRTRPRTNAPPFAIEPLTRHPLTHTPTPHTPPPTHAQIVCGDPECAPIDTAVRIIYEGKDDGAVGTAFAFPCTAVELTKEALDERMPPAETYEDWYEGRPTHWPPPPEDVVLRFAVGTRVECKVGTKQWAVGYVTKHWFRQGDWPPGVFAPYQVQLDDGRLIFAPDDANRCIRGEGAGKKWFGCLGG